MKYFAIGVGTLSVLLGLCLLFSRLSILYLEETEAPLREAAAFFPAEDSDAILSLVQESRLAWESHRGFFSSILSHSELEDVAYSFDSLTAYAARGEMAELEDVYSRLLSMLHHLRQQDNPSYYNILSCIVNQYRLF